MTNRINFRMNIRSVNQIWTSAIFHPCQDEFPPNLDKNRIRDWSRLFFRTTMEGRHDQPRRNIQVQVLFTQNIALLLSQSHRNIMMTSLFRLNTKQCQDCS
ncbi:hypothetical protein H112_07524 [Trichophyton rubrum D6]|uniref:Uncharacterized protein n=3 Tax=Trichophyton TaxID=5550 RepID=A0A087PFH1_TRIRC|nr:uncharacterized protein TERG_11519 [Trichophyton rubrum CBS 118892]EZF11333.1 hypothetical protein H100_07550 [Trichophyton rubrum MR850]EZF48869.1 hypothetical protein H103_07537 [Trichophyton rubrum CBS 288.86]EZF59502.1 hypothetical protein H104_07484 [Trichophyton rubrum CBS 289.86]EZF70013.1 hypothetical protein H105_07541 [Trichophyton soudanense CBS 452.61]EZF80860.1 hypothetical protein H110_07530 [Trichophyton rubrum MR1448]EZF91516.1 hypothetical protein H113_07590 [Trichophyton 